MNKGITFQIVLISVAAAVQLAAHGCEKKQFVPPRTGPSTPYEERVLSIVATQFGLRPDEIDVKESFEAQGIKADELDIIELVMEVEDEFSLTIPDAAVVAAIGAEKPDAGKLSVAFLASVAEQAAPATRPATAPVS